MDIDLLKIINLYILFGVLYFSYKCFIVNFTIVVLPIPSSPVINILKYIEYKREIYLLFCLFSIVCSICLKSSSWYFSLPIKTSGIYPWQNLVLRYELSAINDKILTLDGLFAIQN